VFSQNGLSLDQAPPISVVFRFFLSGALFGILAGMMILVYHDRIFDLSDPAARILTHTLTLGVMLSFMFAALFQMLPVIAGVKLSAPITKANLLLYPFVLGIFFLLGAFALPEQTWLFLAASLLLGTSILWISLVMLKKLFALSHHSSSSKGMSVALVSLGIVILLALYMTWTLSGLLGGEEYQKIKIAHYSFGLFGWIALLIISISFQVIEMFYVTPAYPKKIADTLPIILVALLLTTLALSFWISGVWQVSHTLIAITLSGYALLTLRKLSQRKRPVADATVWFWRAGLAALLISMGALLIDKLTSSAFPMKIFAIFYAVFALSIVLAMFYKIVPFLTWFHLNSEGYFTAPMMHEVIHPKTAMKHLYIHLAMVVIFVLSLLFAPLLYLAGILTILSFVWMLWQIIHAWRLYRQTQKTGEKFEMNANMQAGSR